MQGLHPYCNTEYNADNNITSNDDTYSVIKVKLFIIYKGYTIINRNIINISLKQRKILLTIIHTVTNNYKTTIAQFNIEILTKFRFKKSFEKVTIIAKIEGFVCTFVSKLRLF